LKKRFNQEDKFFIGGYIPGSKGVDELLIGEYQHAVTEEVMAKVQWVKPEQAAEIESWHAPHTNACAMPTSGDCCPDPARSS
jgi:hypothetical protein